MNKTKQVAIEHLGEQVRRYAMYMEDNMKAIHGIDEILPDFPDEWRVSLVSVYQGDYSMNAPFNRITMAAMPEFMGKNGWELAKIVTERDAVKQQAWGPSQKYGKSVRHNGQWVKYSLSISFYDHIDGSTCHRTVVARRVETREVEIYAWQCPDPKEEES